MLGFLASRVLQNAAVAVLIQMGWPEGTLAEIIQHPCEKQTREDPVNDIGRHEEEAREA